MSRIEELSRNPLIQKYRGMNLSDIFTKEEFVRMIIEYMWPLMVVQKVDPTDPDWTKTLVGRSIRFPLFEKSVTFHTVLPVTEDILEELGNPKDVKAALYGQFVDIIANKYNEIASIEHGYMEGDPNHF